MATGKRASCIAAAAWLLLLADPAPAGKADNATTFGPNAELVAGAQALQMGDYADGVRLTLAGLAEVTERRQRAVGLSNLCAGYAGLGEYRKALAACNESLAINPRSWRSYNNRAIAYIGLGRLVEARRDLEAGRALNPDAAKLREVEALLRAREAELRRA
ncbi:MAG: hypothetical protein D6727_03020 [Gammaproteobacteria bacterium]|nr:MAG: hypothetical protein D6727_03020 [Gammaproteobacteria bacterium]